MKRPFLSIIIPAYKAASKLPCLLDSIFATSGLDNYEVIVVDDQSPDDTARVVKNYGRSIRYILLKRNSGPAKARNIGARKAKGKVLLFLDSDVICYADTILRVTRAFFKDKDLTALTGVWTRPRSNKQFFPNYKALRDWSYWINERSRKGYYYLFSTRIAAIKKDVFLRLGGFNEAYRGADIEDIEFTYKIASRYAILFDEKIRVRHEFEEFGPIAKKYFRRSFFWSQLFAQRKKFDPVAMTASEAITGMSAVLVAPLAILGFFVNELLLLIPILFLINLWGGRKFLIYVYQMENLLFAVKSFFTSFILFYVIYAGAALAVLAILIERLFGSKAAKHFNLTISEIIR